MEKIYFSKIKPNAKIPIKTKNNAGYDIYACFDAEEIIIKPNERTIIPTGIASSFSNKYFFLLEERGSTGIKMMARRSGVIDSNFRGEWNVVLNNTGNKIIHITKKVNEVIETNTDIFYPYSKGICQAVFLPVPVVEIEEISYEELKKIPSDRGDGKFGSTGH